MADTSYITVPIETDPATLAAQVFDELQIAIPGWIPSDGNLDARLISAFASLSAVTRDLASDVPQIIFETFGASFMGLPEIQGSSAQISSTWTARDSAGYTIPQGTLVQGTDSQGNVTVWEVYDDYTIPPASTSVASVILSAVAEGSAVNGTVYLAGQVVLIDDLEFVSTIITNTVAVGGEDEEDEDAYLNRLHQVLSILTPRPILPGDFSILAMTQPGIFRATTIDGYDPVAATFNNAREVTIYVMDATGHDPSSPQMTSLEAYMEAQREVNFIVNVRGAAPIGIETHYVVVASAGVDHAQLKIDIDAAIANFLTPLNWGIPEVGDAPAWTNKPFVYYFELAAIIQDVFGVDHITTLTLQLGTGNASLTGSGPVGVPVWLPDPTSSGTIT